MVFSSPAFLFVFLPVCFILYRLLPNQTAKNVLLTLASVVFYAFGEPVYVLLLLMSVVVNYICGRIISLGRLSKKLVMVLAVVINLGFLSVFKYTDFAVSTVNHVFGLNLALPGIALPVGISFFTFQGLSYVIDVYRDKTLVSCDLLKLALYISFFPQLIAGPIVKYHDVSLQIDRRKTTPALTAAGLRRFILGLSKKLLLSNTVGQMADMVFTAAPMQLDARTAWLGAVCYCLQIYFDFSGYSDMAIGLGHMFGAGISLCPAGFGTTCTSRWEATAGEGFAPSLTSASCSSAPVSGMEQAGTSCSGGFGMDCLLSLRACFQKAAEGGEYGAM